MQTQARSHFLPPETPDSFFGEKTSGVGWWVGREAVRSFFPLYSVYLRLARHKASLRLLIGKFCSRTLLLFPQGMSLFLQRRQKPAGIF